MSRRLLASYLTLAAIVLLALEIPLGITLARNERRDLTTKVERDAVALASLSQDILEGAGPTKRLAAVAGRYSDETGGRAVIVNVAGTAVADTSDPAAHPRSFASRPEIAQALRGRTATGTRHSDTLGTDLLYVAVPVASGGTVHGAVRITYPTSRIDERVRRTWMILGAIAVVVLGVAALVGMRFSHSIATPLARVERAAGAAGDGDLGVRAPVDGPPEVRSLAMRFNQMVARLADLVRSQEAFVADASHQLRTPLAALRLRLENLGPCLAEGGQEPLEAAISELDRLNRVVDGLLVLARADTGAGAREAVDLVAPVGERTESWGALADEQGVTVVARIQHGLAVAATPGRLEQVLDNLIENALAVSPPGGRITVGAASTAEGVVLHVVDEGPGMTDAERARAFDRFWRSERAGSDGTGLGLAIVQRLIESDGGSVELRPAAGRGLDVTITLRRLADRSSSPAGVRTS